MCDVQVRSNSNFNFQLASELLIVALYSSLSGSCMNEKQIIMRTKGFDGERLVQNFSTFELLADLRLVVKTFHVISNFVLICHY